MSADAWLREHDPDYEQSRRRWKDIRDSGDYWTPRQEVPVGLSADLDRLIEIGEADYLDVPQKRACERCFALFEPTNAWHRYCSDLCKQRARPRRQRDRASYMREYRRRAA